MTSTKADSVFELPRHTKVLLVLDVVESVRLMEGDEHGFVQRWQQLLVRTKQLLQLHQGRMVKSLGDGLMLEFPDAQSCVQTAFALQQFVAAGNADVPSDRQVHLRMGSHLADFVADEHDIYGTDVNLTARVTTLAGPGELVVTAEVRDRLIDSVDAEIEDLGDCHLKHVKELVRAYRVGQAGHAPVLPARNPTSPDFRPTVAVIPFEARSDEPEHFVIGELVADGVIAQLSRSGDLRVISRLSTTAFRGRNGALPAVEEHLGATFVLSGSYVARGGKILIMAELADARNNRIVWADRISGDTMDLLQAESELLDRIAAAAGKALLQSEVQQALTQPLPRLDSCSLLLGGIAHMHQSSPQGFDRSRQVLEALVERHNRAAIPRAWLAKWHILRVVRGMSDAPDRDARQAIEQTERALDNEPESALALAIQGHALCQLSGDPERARDRIHAALEFNPNESLAWLYKSVWSSMWGSTADSVTEARTAADLSPVDPMKYYYDMILATRLSINGEYEQALELAQRSLKANRHHQPTMRALLFSQARIGRTEDARQTLQRLIAENPGFSVASYLAMGGGGSQTRREVASVLRQLGAPEH